MPRRREGLFAVHDREEGGANVAFSFGLDDAVDRRRALEKDEVRVAILAILDEGPLQDAVMLRTSYSSKSSGVFSMTSSETPSLSLKWSLGRPSPAASAAIHEYLGKAPGAAENLTQAVVTP
jgi:hypothetical protein